MHETEKQYMKNGFILKSPPMWRLVKPVAVIREGCSMLQLAPSLSPMVENGPKGDIKVKVAQG